MIVRGKAPPEAYMRYPTGIAEDASLSYGARGMLGYLICRGAVSSVAELANSNLQGISATRTIFKELEAAGYVVRGKSTKRNGGCLGLTLWRTAVYERDRYTCQRCGAKGGQLNAHHIVPWCLSPAQRFDIDNGITLCVKCHRLEHRPGWKKRAAA